MRRCINTYEINKKDTKSQYFDTHKPATPHHTSIHSCRHHLYTYNTSVHIPVHGAPISISRYYFWRQVLGGAAQGEGAVQHALCKTEISQSYVP